MNDDKTPNRFAYGCLLVCTVLVATVTFLLSFSGLDDYGGRVAGLGWLSPLVPIGVDGLTLCAVAATFLLRHARFRVRLYAWWVFSIAVASSVAGNLSHAAARALSWEGMVGAAAWPILLALASHMVIVVRRNMDAPAPSKVARPDTSVPAPAVPKAPVFLAPVSAPPTPPEAPVSGAPAGDDLAGQKVRQDTRSAQQIEAVVRAVKSADPTLSQRKVAEVAMVSPTTVRRILQAVQEEEVVQPKPVNGRVPELTDVPL